MGGCAWFLSGSPQRAAHRPWMPTRAGQAVSSRGFMRNPLLRQRDVVIIERQQLNGKRIAMLLLALLDLAALVVLFFQLSETGFPTTADMLSDSVHSLSPKEFWFIPFAIACAFPVLGALGAILLWQLLLWI